MNTQHYSRRRFTSQLLGGAITLGLSPLLFAQKPLISEDEIDEDVKEMGIGKGGQIPKDILIDFLPKRRDWLEMRYGIFHDTRPVCVCVFCRIPPTFMSAIICIWSD